MINVGILEAILRLKDQLSPAILKAGQNVSKVGAKFKKTGKALLPLSAALSLTGGIALKFAADFDSAMTQSTAIMGDLGTSTKQEFDGMRQTMETTAREVAKTTTFSATQAAESYFFLASAGLDAKTSIQALPQVAQFAQAGMFDMATATDLLTDAQSALGLTIRDTETGIIDVAATMENMARVSDILVKANTLANSTVEQFSTALTTKAGTSLKSMGKSVEEGVAVLAAFADQGVKAQMAGTGLSIILRDLSTKAIKNEEVWKSMGLSVFDAGGNMRNLGNIIQDLEMRFDGMNDKQKKTELLALGFSDRSVTFVQSLMGMGDQIVSFQEQLEQAGGTTEEIAEKQLESFSNQLSLAGSRIKDVGITLGQELLPIALDFLNWLEPVIGKLADLASWFADLPDGIKNTGFAIAGIITVASPFLLLIGSLISAIGTLWPIIVTMAGAVSGLAAVVSPLVVPLGAVAATAALAFGVGSALREIPVVTKAANALADAFFNVSRNAKGMVDASSVPLSAQDLRLMKEATELAEASGDAIPQTIEEAQAYMNETIKNMQMVSEGMEEVRKGAEEAAGGVADIEPPLVDAGIEAGSTGKSMQELGLHLQELPPKIQTANEKWAENIKQTKRAAEELKEHERIMGLAESRLTQMAARWEAADFVAGIPLVPIELEDLPDAADNAVDSIEELSDKLEMGANFARLFGEGFATAFTGLSTGIAGFKQAKDALGKSGGIKGLFSDLTGGSGAKGIFGGLSSLAGMLPGIGSMVGPVIGVFKGLFGKSKGDIQKIVKDNVGAAISDGLAQSILDSGKDYTAFLTEMFEEGAITGDKMATEVGDIFAKIGDGRLSSPEGIAAIESAIPTLIANFEQLGPTGQQQIERIIDAASNMGIEFEGLDELLKVRITDETLQNMGLVGETNIQHIRQAAKDLGVEFEFLRDKVQETFAPDTVEEMSEKFNLTNEQVQGLAEKLGVDVQTNLQRMAATLGLTVGEFKALGEAVQQEYGIPMEEIGALLESMGVDAKTLADAMGVDVKDLEDTTAGAADDIAKGADNAARLANELERARNAAGGINVNIPDFGGEEPAFSGQTGIDRKIGSKPQMGLFHPGERVLAIPKGKPGNDGKTGVGGGGQGVGSVTINITPSPVTVSMPNAVAADEKVAELVAPGVSIAFEKRMGETIPVLVDKLKGVFPERND